MNDVLNFQVLQNTCLPTDHAPLALTLKTCLSPSYTAERAQDLGQSVLPRPPCKPRLSMKSIDINSFQSNLPEPELFWQVSTSLQDACDFITNSMFNAAQSAKVIPRQPPRYEAPKNATERWNNILSQNDPRKVWKSIDWKGQFTDVPSSVSTPSDEEFCKYLSELLNPTSGIPADIVIPDTEMYVPILDDDFEPHEIEECIKALKPDKAAGVDGIPPGLFKALPDEWLLILTFLFNMVFSGVYPLSWALAKLFMIYKKGDRLLPSNYRGISIVTAISKLYDMVLNARFIKWYTPSPEQAGSQKGRSCEEQILVIRLLIDVARKLCLMLYIGFVDYCKAYDTVNRNKLLKMLAAAGCGKKFLHAVANSLRNTSSKIGESQFTSSRGVRQGGPNSCSMFTFYVDCIIKAINETGEDGWLRMLHCLMQMDDTVILATNRTRFIEKLTISKCHSDILDQDMHPVKSCFLTCNTDDTEPIYLDNVVIKHVPTCVYLGTTLSNAPISEQAKMHLNSKNGSKLKFLSFLVKNPSAPFAVKEKVWSSAMISSLYYSCDTWLGCSAGALQSPYLQTLKRMLGVRVTTVNEFPLAELGIPSPIHFVRCRQSKFLNKLYARPNFASSYVGWAISEAIRCKTTMGNAIKKLREAPPLPEHDRTIQSLQASTTTRRVNYCLMNPHMQRNSIYNNTRVPEYARISATRMRLSSHSLKIETGRWSRIDPNRRVCSCDQHSIQNEDHVLFHCPLTDHIRVKFHELNSYDSVPTLFSHDNPVIVALFCHDVLNCF